MADSADNRDSVTIRRWHRLAVWPVDQVPRLLCEHRMESVSRVLVLEDDPDVGPLLEQLLIADGREVDVATTTAEARGLLAENDYDLVLADGKLPDGNGLDIADEAKRRGLVAIVLTGYALAMPVDRLCRHEFLLKPVGPKELLSHIYRHIGPGRLAHMTGAQ